MALVIPYLKRNDNGTLFRFIRLFGAVADQTEQVESISRPGIDGVAFRTIGKKSEGTQWNAVRDVETKSDAAQLVSDLRSLQGEFVELGDEIGTRFFNVMVLLAQANGTPRRITTAVGGREGGDGEYIVSMVFQLQFTEV